MVADQTSRGIGSPFSLPGALIESARTGRKIADYDAAIFRRPFSMFFLRFGDDDVPFLRAGFSLPQGTGDFLHRTTRDGWLEAPLQGAQDYVLGVRLRGREGESLLIEVNRTLVGSCPLARELKDCELDVPAARLRAGENEIQLQVQSSGSPQTSDAQVHAFWLKPRR